MIIYANSYFGNIRYLQYRARREKDSELALCSLDDDVEAIMLNVTFSTL